MIYLEQNSGNTIAIDNYHYTEDSGETFVIEITDDITNYVKRLELTPIFFNERYMEFMIIHTKDINLQDLDNGIIYLIENLHKIHIFYNEEEIYNNILYVNSSVDEDIYVVEDTNEEKKEKFILD